MNKFLKLTVFTMGVAALLTGCATATKRMEPAAKTDAGTGTLLKGMDVTEQPELEPDWADWVKDHYPNWRHHYWVDRGQWGNRGYVIGRAASESTPPTTEITPLPPAQPPTIVETTPPAPIMEKTGIPESYTVKKGDSLWKIAGKVYRNPLKWPKIYHANKDKIKNPHKIFPGQVLSIPQ